MAKGNTCKLAILSGSICSRNMGCNALTYGALELLSEASKRLNIECEYYLVGNDPGGVIPRELAAYKIRLMESIPDVSVSNLVRWTYCRTLSKQLHLRRVLQGVDIFCDNAWGDSFSDIYGRERFEEVMYHLNFALQSRKPLILLPQTIGPFKDVTVREQAKRVLAAATAVYARDPSSSACAKEMIPHLDVCETVDVALFMQYTPRDAARRNCRVIGINPSGLLWSGGYTRNNQFGLRDDYQAMMKRLVKYLLSIDGVVVELVGHDVRGPNMGNIDDDYYVCKLIQKEFPCCKVAPFFYSPVEAKSYISGMDMLIGSRMHCCIAAYSSGVPVYPLAYSRKFRGLFVEGLDYPHVSDLTEESCAEVISGIVSLMGGLDSLKIDMQERIRRLQAYRRKMVDDLSMTIGRVVFDGQR